MSNKVDWEEVERLYRADIKTNAQLAEQFGVDPSTIYRRAKKHNWKKDLKKKIKERANTIVQEKAVERFSSEQIERDEQTIDENANILAGIRIKHREDISSARKIMMTMFEDLQAQVGIDNRQRLEDLLMNALEQGVIDEVQFTNTLERVTSLALQAKIMKDLADSMTKLVGLERTAYGLDEEDTSPVDALTELLHSIANTNKNGLGIVKQDPEYDDEVGTNSIGVSDDG